jgi:hypothetical protein
MAAGKAKMGRRSGSPGEHDGDRAGEDHGGGVAGADQGAAMTKGSEE